MLKNHRSISLLPQLSKIIERIVHDQTEEFLSKKTSVHTSVGFLEKLLY